MKFKPFVHYTLSRIFARINRLIPKDEKVIMFISTPDFSDNPRYLYEKAKSLLEGYTFVWVVRDKSKFQSLEDDSTIFVQYRTVEYLRWILKSKYLVLSHGIPYWKSGNQVAILLWHGIPLKAPLKFSKMMVDYLVFPSSFSATLLKAYKNILYNEFLDLGQPRCDSLFMSQQGYKQLKKKFAYLVGREIYSYNAVTMYLPTYRDYQKSGTGGIIQSLLDNQVFLDFLDREGVLFVVKPHPLDESFVSKFESENVVVLKNSDLVSKFLTLYDILPAVDILVTDYSSVYFDYLLLNRPIVFHIPDLEKYRETRGFLLEPYEKWTPGDKARTPEELVVALEEAINNPKKWERERLWLRDVMFKYQDGKASERIIKYFWGEPI